MDVIQLILEILDLNKRQFVAKMGSFIGIQVTAVAYWNELSREPSHRGYKLAQLYASAKPR